MANCLVTEKFNLSFSGTYTDAEAEMDQIDFSSNALAGYDFDLSTVDEYSDLDIQQIDLSVGANYQVDDNFSVGLGFTYLRYDDDEPYLYDGTGVAYISNMNVSFLF
jgi:long-subunit fatty acid transport protein